MDFTRDVRPILASKCYACHGPDEESREADLRLDMPAKDFDTKTFLHRIITTDPDDVMPPPKSPKPLTAAEKDVLRQWIASGANYEPHWAFQPIRNPKSHHDIDGFVRAELTKHGLQSAPRANASTLIRRLYLDLIGLPPPSDTSDSSDLSDESYAALVDRLLADPRFGERWGRHWLDMARYADSNGFLGDGLRPNAYRYRDWVIQAFNNDMPYDEFTISQIAGDLLDNREPGTENRELSPGTGFHRNAALNTEAGVDKEEARYQNLVDRVNTIGRVWMGLTIGCAQCHTHKYDPITIRDYYSFYAFFDNTEDRDDAKTKAPLLAEVSKDRRQTYVHLAGDYTRRGPDVMPATLSALPAQAGNTRLELAKWLVSPQNPLTARVAVNHIWSKFFGHGLVRTPDDFGTSGEAPSHPELLDWLATDFMRNGWSRKQLIKRIVMSETYRQASHHPSDRSDQTDPLNRMLSRQNRIRLDAEILRDSALAVSGLLKPNIGGPSFRPPLPEDVFDVGRSSNWQASPGDEIYRRSLYIITLRSVLYPTLTTFDAPDAADACVRRERSNTPLQALTMMNDGVFVEAAQSLALRAMHEGPNPLEKLFRLVLSRSPRAEELARLQTFHAEQKARVMKSGPAALQVLGAHQNALSPAQATEAATFVAMARVLLNLDEFINRE
ncbi:MAG: PSD1 domain-containing protein [Prosthecobacter sp.]|uniref:PSD1 and planctomycete cytochrome C domain-containing protein n=1 Tax=Prosthecobacter sp. TaxID=1965333 RepID=UPI001A0832B3|nr:PSD1 and planctomycete cytochrome C domain-containing protein [Prosthecobacter sp.]MBE2285406.1 PSD1 domain-containing protein [Prosthecobacter sp.]